MRFTSDVYALVFRGDLGGFWVGPGIFWNFLGGFERKLSDSAWFTFQYRIFDVDYDEGSGESTAGLDANLNGPAMGLSFRF
jgi:hypothetical protein